MTGTFILVRQKTTVNNNNKDLKKGQQRQKEEMTDVLDQQFYSLKNKKTKKQKIQTKNKRFEKDRKRGDGGGP